MKEKTSIALPIRLCGWEIPYLVLPALAFSLGYLRPEIGIPLALLLGAGLFHALPRPWPEFDWRPVPVAVFFTVLVLLFTGFPDGPWPWDWAKHWAILKVLSEESWPVVVEISGVQEHLRYFIGGYLFPALAHKAFPFVDATIFFVIWIFIGVFLALRLVCTLEETHKKQVLAVLLFLFLGSASPFLTEQSFNVSPNFGFRPSSLTSFVWVPLQFSATVLCAGVMISGLNGGRLQAVFLGYGVLTLWSPYGAIGLLPVVLFLAWQRRKDLFERTVVLAAAGGAAIGLVMVSYLSVGVPVHAQLSCFHPFCSYIKNPYTFAFALLLEWFLGILCFLLILGKRVFSRPLPVLCVFGLFLLHYAGTFTTDLVHRGSMGLSFILLCYAIRKVLDFSTLKRDAIFYVIALLISLPVNANLMWYIQIEKRACLKAPAAVKKYYTVKEFLSLPPGHVDLFRPQYFSKTPSWLIKQKE